MDGKMIGVAGAPIGMELSYSHDKIVLLNGQETLRRKGDSVHRIGYDREWVEGNTGV